MPEPFNAKPKFKIKKNDSLRDLFCKLGPEDSEVVRTAIMKTRNFLLLTSLQLKVRREEVITPADIEKILNEPAASLKNLRESQGGDQQHAEQAKEVLEYCRQALENQLNVLCEFNDSIYKYYKDNPNALRDELENERRGPKPASS